MQLTKNESAKRILIVDDSSDNLLVMQGILATQGYCILTANSASTARTLVEEELTKPDLVIFSITTSSLNRWEFINCLRTNQQLPYIPVLLLTSDRNISPQEIIKTGADELLYKPFDLDELLSSVSSLITQQEITNIAKSSAKEGRHNQSKQSVSAVVVELKENDPLYREQEELNDLCQQNSPSDFWQSLSLKGYEIRPFAKVFQH